MKLMIEKEKRYEFYESTGEKPEVKDLYRQIGAPPTAPPVTVDDIKKEDGSSNNAQIEQSPTSSTDKKTIDDPKSGKESLFFRSYFCGTENFVPRHQDFAILITQDLSHQHAKNVFYYSKSGSVSSFLYQL